MDQLRFTGLHEDGTHVVVTATDGTDFIVAADERLRAALRQSAVQSAPRTTAATPREVQTQIRAGLSAEEVAETTGWTIERVQRYEGPILAERAHVARLGSACVVRTHDRSGPAPTLEARVRDRLHARGVNTDHVTWDSRRPEGGQWSVQVQFMAGQRTRHASWSFDVAARSVEAIDDEARWLSEDEQSLPASAPAAAAVFGAGIDGPDDLISSMRERSRRRGQTGGRRRKGAAPVSGTDGSNASPMEGDQELPLKDPLTGSESGQSGQASDEVFDPPAGSADVSISDDVAFATAKSLDGDEAGDGYRADDDLGVEDDDENSAADDSADGHTTLDDFFGTGEDDDDDDEVDDVHNANDGEVDADAQDADASTEAEAKLSASGRGRKGRPSVPSWDDIMFGARDRKN